MTTIDLTEEETQRLNHADSMEINDQLLIISIMNILECKAKIENALWVFLKYVSTALWDLS